MLLQKVVIKKIEPGWFLLENQSTADVFRNSRLVQNIHNYGGGYITIHRNAGKLRDTKEATIKVCGAVWFDEEDITNILYFSMIMDNYSVCYDTEGK